MARPADPLVLAALALAACNAQSPVSPQASSASASNPAPAFDASLVPPAAGEGNFEICLTNDAAENGITRVNLPANILFQSWGPLTKSLRERNNYDLVAVTDHHELTAYALVTTLPLTISKNKPCAITPVRMATNDGFNWTQKSTPASLHYVFAPQPMLLKGAKLTNVYWGESLTGKPNGQSRGGVTGDAIANEYFAGIPLKAVGDAVALDDSD